jgi:hypothetical protein
MVEGVLQLCFLQDKINDGTKINMVVQFSCHWAVVLQKCSRARKLIAEHMVVRLLARPLESTKIWVRKFQLVIAKKETQF